MKSKTPWRTSRTTHLMDEIKQYKTAGGFRSALEARLQARAQEEKTDLQRLRRQVAFDRLLGRLFPKGPKGTYPWMLKGSHASVCCTKARTLSKRARSSGSTPRPSSGATRAPITSCTPGAARICSAATLPIPDVAPVMTIVFMLILRLQMPTAVDAAMLRSSVFRRKANGGYG